MAKNPDYMAGMTSKRKGAKLAKMSYQDYLLHVAKVSPDAIAFFMGNGGRNNKRVDTTPALEAAEHGLPGFNGLGLTLEENSTRVPTRSIFRMAMPRWRGFS